MNSDRRILRVVEYDPTWPEQFEHEARDLSAAFAPAFQRAYHVGSTSVPGMAAKPTIDIAVELEAGTVIPDYDKQLERLGYVCRGECLDAPVPGIPGRFYYVKHDGPTHLVHVHAYESGHADLAEKLLLRDYLRANGDAALRYATVKKALVKEFALDNVAYMQGKDQTVKMLIDEARRWRTG